MDNPFNDKKSSKDKTSLVILFLPESIIAVILLLCSPVQAVLLFMHDKVPYGIGIIISALISGYGLVLFLEKRQLYLAYIVMLLFILLSINVGYH